MVGKGVLGDNGWEWYLGENLPYLIDATKSPTNGNILITHKSMK